MSRWRRGAFICRNSKGRLRSRLSAASGLTCNCRALARARVGPLSSSTARRISLHWGNRRSDDIDFDWRRAGAQAGRRSHVRCRRRYVVWRAREHIAPALPILEWTKPELRNSPRIASRNFFGICCATATPRTGIGCPGGIARDAPSPSGRICPSLSARRPSFFLKGSGVGNLAPAIAIGNKNGRVNKHRDKSGGMASAAIPTITLYARCSFKSAATSASTSAQVL